MSSEDAQVVVCDNPDEERYELLVDDRLVGEIQYHHRRSSDRIAFIHTGTAGAYAALLGYSERHEHEMQPPHDELVVAQPQVTHNTRSWWINPAKPIRPSANGRFTSASGRWSRPRRCR